MKLLVIDDSNALLKLVELKLSAYYEVLTTDNPMTAAFIIGREKPDIILLDLYMPVVSGEQVLRSLIGNKLVDPARIILFTSYDDDETIVEEWDLGGYIHKNMLDKPQFVDLIRDLNPPESQRFAAR